MGTSGFLGFVLDGEEKFTITPGDSYPGSGGVEVLSWLTAHRGDLPVDRIRALRLVPTTFDDEDALEPVRDALRGGPHEDFADQSVEEVLEFAAYDLDTLLRGGLAYDGGDFPTDSLHCEWGYVVDLDTRMFELYRGFQTTPPTAGRFVGRPPAREGYFPVALVASWPLDALPSRAAFVEYGDS